MGLESVARDLHLPTEMVNTVSNNQTSNVQGSWVNNSTLVHPEQVYETLETNSLRSNEEWTHSSLEQNSLREVDRLHFLKEVFTFKMGLKVANNLISAYRNSTNRQAQSVWKAFQS